MRTPPVSPEIESAARQLKWIATFQTLAWSTVPVAFVSAAILGGMSDLLPDLGPYGSRLFDRPGPFLAVFALVPSALATSFAQQLRRAIAPHNTAEPPQIAFGSVALPFILPAVVYSRLDQALAGLPVSVARTRGAMWALAPFGLLVVGPFVAAFGSDSEEQAILASLFALTRAAWGAMTIRACRSILARAALGSIRAHGDAPVAGG